MKRVFGKLMAAVVVCLCVTSSGWAIVGVGLHYGADFSLNMGDKRGETLDFLSFDVAKIPGVDPTMLERFGGNTTLSGKDIPLFIDRYEWIRNPINFGGKAYIDIIPFLDAVEVSVNFGMWEYKGQMRYPIGIDTTGLGSSSNPAFKDYMKFDSTELTLASVGMPNYFGLLQGTPYAKLHFDATIRKDIFALPKRMKIVRLYAGGGPSIHFGTPMLSPQLIKDAMGAKLENLSGADLQAFLDDPRNLKPVLEEIVTNLFTPHFGMHLIAGLMVKLPVIPVGVYVDGKLQIPFGALDKNVDIGGTGFLVNAGVSFGI